MIAGMKHLPQQDEPIPVAVAARILRVPSRWLRTEIETGRLPGLQADRAILVHVETVRKLLAERARTAVSPEEQGGAR